MLNIKVSVWDTQIPIDGIEKSREQKIKEMLPIARAVTFQNLGLVAKSKLEMEDVEQELSLVVINCVDRFDARYGTKLSTYVWSACLKRLTELVRIQRSKKRYVETVSMYAPIDPAEPEISSNMTVMDAIRRIRESLSPRDRALFDGLLAGEKQTQMAEKFKCTQPAISNRVNILRRNLRWLLED